jgi:allantoicase
LAREIIGQPAAFTGLVDLAARSVGGRAITCSDEWFAEADNLVSDGPAVWDPDRYTERGKWMDGWESRRRRTPGHDWAIVKLGVPGRIRGVDIDTAHFLGNHGPYASVEGAVAPDDASAEDLRDRTEWERVVPQVELKRGSPNLHASVSDRVYTHVRLNMYPDGGIARLRVYGDPEPRVTRGDLASVLAGGRAVACSDSFFSPPNNLVAPGHSTFMGGGWETRRSRPPGMDWIVVRLGRPGVLDRVVLETHHFKGNYPDSASVDGLYWPDAPPSVLGAHPDWQELGHVKLRADAEHELIPEATGPFTHLRLRIWPDGGVSRLRAFGTATDEPPARYAYDAEQLGRCCGSRRWVAKMLADGPYTSRTHLHGHADQVWWHLGDADWREAFSHHPRIGERAASGSFSEGEQSGVRGVGAEVLQALAEANRAYEERYGHIFLVCATGLSAAEMLSRLEARLSNPPEVELRIAAGEQAKITKLRLDKLEVP